MLKRIGLSFALIAAMAATTAFAQAPTDIPPPATRTRINFSPGTSAYTLTTYLTQGVSQGYVFRVAAGQSMFITKTGDASVEVLDPQDVVLVAPSTPAGPWGFQTTTAGDYTVVLYSQGSVTLTVYIPPLGASPQPPVPLPLFRQRIRFGPGSTGYYFTPDLVQGLPAAFALGISAGQQLNVSTQGNVTLALLDPQDNILLPVMPYPARWQFAIPQTGDYTLVLLGSGTISISIDIPPLGSLPMPPPPAAQRIIFAPGTDSLTITPTLIPDVGQAYVLRIARGQTLYASTGSGTKLALYDSQGNQITNTTGMGALVYYIPQDGDYTVACYGQGLTSITFYIPPLR